MTLLSSFIFINFNYKINYKKTQKNIIFKSHKKSKIQKQINVFLKIILKNMSHKKRKTFIKNLYL